MESVNTEKRLPFRVFALLSFLPQKMFMLREGLQKKVSLPRSCTPVAQKLIRVSSHDTCTRNPGGTEKTENNQSMGIITKIFELGNQPFQMLEKFIRFPWVNQEKFQVENVLLNNDNEKAEVSEHKGIIENILALGSRPMQLCKKMIQTLNPFESGKEEESQPKGIIAMISEVIQPWKKTVQTIRDLNNEKAEVSEHKGIFENILALGSWPMQLCKKMIQTLNPFDKFRNELGNLLEKMKELQKENDDITLDAGTAHPNLSIAWDKKSLKHEAQPQKVPPHQERFDSTVCWALKDSPLESTTGRWMLGAALTGTWGWPENP
nr:uncharacterized protein LOC112060583 isoform X5 [Chrysemys picta bellii]